MMSYKAKRVRQIERHRTAVYLTATLANLKPILIILLYRFYRKYCMQAQ